MPNLHYFAICGNIISSSLATTNKFELLHARTGNNYKFVTNDQLLNNAKNHCHTPDAYFLITLQNSGLGRIMSKPQLFHTHETKMNYVKTHAFSSKIKYLIHRTYGMYILSLRQNFSIFYLWFKRTKVYYGYTICILCQLNYQHITSLYEWSVYVQMLKLDHSWRPGGRMTTHSGRFPRRRRPVGRSNARAASRRHGRPATPHGTAVPRGQLKHR